MTDYEMIKTMIERDEIQTYQQLLDVCHMYHLSYSEIVKLENTLRSKMECC